MSHSKTKTIKVLIVEPGRAPYPKEIPNTLESLQHQVGGLIQALYPFEDPAAIICSDEGKLIGLPWNRPLFDENGQIYDVIAGTFLVTGLPEDGFGSLTEEQIQPAYSSDVEFSSKIQSNSICAKSSCISRIG